MSGLVVLPNAARALSLPARPGGRPSREGGQASPALAGFGRPVQNGQKWRRKRLKSLDSRPEMVWPRKHRPPTYGMRAGEPSDFARRPVEPPRRLCRRATKVADFG